MCKCNCFLFEYIFKCNLFMWCKAGFSASLLQSSVLHDPSEIILIGWFVAKETIIIIINVENIVGCNIFVETVIHFFQTFVMNRMFYFYFYLFEMEIFCNIIHAFTVTIDQFNASFLKKSIHFFQKSREVYLWTRESDSNISRWARCTNRPSVTLQQSDGQWFIWIFIWIFC